MGAIFYVSSVPGSAFRTTIPHIDKLAHLGIYTGLGILCIRAYARTMSFMSLALLAFFAVLTTIAYGITDEIHQMFVPLRSFEISDLFFDLCGGMLGAYAYIAYQKRRHNKKNTDNG